MQLSPKQEISIAHSNARLNVWSGSVRSGKTISSLIRWMTFVAQAPTGGALVVSGKTLDSVARNVFGPLQDPGLMGKWASLVRYTRGASTATILGRTIEIITANDVRAEEKLRGLTCAGAYVDEITVLPEAFWQQLLARLSVKDAKLFGTTNPDGPAHWFRKKFLLRERELNLRSWHFTLDDNPGLDPAYVKALKVEYVGLWYRRFILGEWCLAEGAVYEMFDPERHVVDTLPDIQRWIALGVDYGTTNPFAAEMLGVGVDGRLYVGREFWWDSKAQRRALTDVEYSAKLRTWLDNEPIPGTNIVGVRPQYTIVDPSAASFIQQLHRDGVTPMPAINDVLDGIRTVSSLLATDRLFIHRSCRALLDEMPGYSWDPKKAEKGEDAPVKVDDHAVDALRYAVHTTQVAWRSQLTPTS